MKDNDATPADEGELVRADALPEQAEDDADIGEDGDTCEIEHEGRTYHVPAALKGGFLRHADYTRKTQELADHRRTLEAERAAVAEQAQAHEGASQDRIRLAALDHQVAEFQGVDWPAFARQDPQRAEALWRTYEGLNQTRDQLAAAVVHHEHGRKLAAAREAAEAMAETGRVLSREIDGWSPELAGKLTDYAQGHGVTLEELSQASDPRVWKILHRAYVADQAGQRDAVAKAQAVRPAVSVAGSAVGAGGVRDELGTKEWMRRRNEQMRKGR